MNIGAKVIVTCGHFSDEAATIVRRAECVEHYFVTLDRYAGDRMYRDVEYGPFVVAELAAKN